MYEIGNIADILEQELPEIVTKIAQSNKLEQFVNNPDFLEERLKKWHQFGLVTHTKKVRNIFLNELKSYLTNWGVFDKVFDTLNKKIEDVEKKTLFEISIPLHDLGKVVCYGKNMHNREHELASQQLIYENFLNNKLSGLGLSNKHIDYIANCVRTHDAIGKEIRDKLKESNKLDMGYLQGNMARMLCDEVSLKYNEIKTEIGVFFLCDSLGKTDLRITDESEIIKTLEKRNLPSQLKYAVRQLPLNLKIAEIYLSK